MPRGKKAVEQSHGLLATIEAQYLAALRFSRDQLDRRIAALEGHGGVTAPTAKAKKSVAPSTKSGGAVRKPRNYEVLKAKITKPMTIVEMLKALDMKPKQEGTLRQTMQNYKGLFKSDNKRPATYTLDASR